jgi:hypothetical protein
MISRAPQGVQGELAKLVDAGEHEKALKVMRALRYFEKYPRAFGGPAPPWHSCLVESGEIIDVSMDVIDVEAVILEVVLTKVVKAEPGSPSGATSLAPLPIVKLEKRNDDQAPGGSILGTKVHKQFAGYGWYDGEVISSEASVAGKVKVHWHDGTTTLMSIADVEKFRSQAGPALNGAKCAKPASAVARALSVASLRHLPHDALVAIASFSPPPAVYSMCLTSACFHQPVENATGRHGDHVLLATRLLRASLLSGMSRTLRAHSAKEEFDADVVQGRGLSLAALQVLHGTTGSSIPGFLISGSIVLQAVLGVDYGSVEYEAGSDIDLFCTSKAAAAVRSMLVGCGYMLCGFPEDYNDLGSGSTAGLLESNVHHVESYCPVNDSALHYLKDYEEACRNGKALGERGWDSFEQLFNPIAIEQTEHHTVECLPGQELPFNHHCIGSKVLDLIVAKATCEDARGLLKSFDITICKCSFDGQIFRIPDPHLTFTEQTRLEPTRMDLMLAVCKVCKASMQGKEDICRTSWGKLCKVARTGAFAKAGVFFEENQRNYAGVHEMATFEFYPREDPWEDQMYMPHIFYLNFFHRLFSRHQKYAKRGIKFVDRKAHAKFMKIDTTLIALQHAR